ERPGTLRAGWRGRCARPREIAEGESLSPPLWPFRKILVVCFHVALVSYSRTTSLREPRLSRCDPGRSRDEPGLRLRRRAATAHPGRTTLDSPERVFDRRIHSELRHEI